jgi:hypothetical protein
MDFFILSPKALKPYFFIERSTPPARTAGGG